jgi:hypothetical protein
LAITRSCNQQQKLATDDYDDVITASVTLKSQTNGNVVNNLIKLSLLATWGVHTAKLARLPFLPSILSISREVLEHVASTIG